LAETSGGGVTDAVRAVVDLIAAQAAPSTAKPTAGKFHRSGATAANPEVVLSSRQIGTLTGLGPSAAYHAVKSATDLGFLVNNETKRGKPFRLEVRQRVDEAAAGLLPHPDTLVLEGAIIEPRAVRRFAAVSNCFKLFQRSVKQPSY
jgi:hypothetical protein